MSRLDNDVAFRQFFLFDVQRSYRINYLYVQGLPYSDTMAPEYPCFLE
jgi:hypothetical protein